VDDLLRIGAAIVIFGHGMAHIVASPVALGVVRQGMDAPIWMSPRLRLATFPLWLAAAAGLIAGAVGLIADASWFRVPAVAGAAISTILLTAWCSELPIGGKLGVVFSPVLMVVLVVGA
jgi:hypothetical protein